jgi:hypothetical protein
LHRRGQTRSSYAVVSDHLASPATEYEGLPKENRVARPMKRSTLHLLVLCCSVLALIPGLACGNVLSVPEVTVPIPEPTTLKSSEPASTPNPTVTPSSTRYPTRTATPTPTAPTSTSTPLPVQALRPDGPARVLARQGLNVREEPAAAASQVGRLAPGSLVVVLEGPTLADGFRWWRLDSSLGIAGWAADGDDEDVWLTGDVGEPRSVNRPVRVGDRVTVTTRGDTHLALRYDAAGTLIRRVPAGTQFEVIDGPVDAESFRWWQLRDDDGLEGWGAEGDREDRWLTPIE